MELSGIAAGELVVRRYLQGIRLVIGSELVLGGQQEKI